MYFISSLSVYQCVKCFKTDWCSSIRFSPKQYKSESVKRYDIRIIWIIQKGNSCKHVLSCFKVITGSKGEIVSGPVVTLVIETATIHLNNCNWTWCERSYSFRFSASGSCNCCPSITIDPPPASTTIGSSNWLAESGDAPVLRRLKQCREKRNSRIRASECVIWEDKWRCWLLSSYCYTVNMMIAYKYIEPKHS